MFTSADGSKDSPFRPWCETVVQNSLKLDLFCDVSRVKRILNALADGNVARPPCVERTRPQNRWPEGNGHGHESVTHIRVKAGSLLNTSDGTSVKSLFRRFLYVAGANREGTDRARGITMQTKGPIFAAIGRPVGTPMPLRRRPCILLRRSRTTEGKPA